MSDITITPLAQGLSFGNRVDGGDLHELGDGCDCVGDLGGRHSPAGRAHQLDDPEQAVGGAHVCLPRR